MTRAMPQLLLNCPKCNSGKLQFIGHTKSKDATEVAINPSVYLECMDCKFHKDGKFGSLLDAASDWNKR